MRQQLQVSLRFRLFLNRAQTGERFIKRNDIRRAESAAGEKNAFSSDCL